MSKIPQELKYTDEHEWLRTEADGVYTVGITDHAQNTLGDIVFVELPQIGQKFAAGDPAGVVESVKAASEFYTPVAGEVIAVNEDLTEDPDTINEDAYDAWIVKIKASTPTSTVTLLDAAAYAKLLGE